MKNVRKKSENIRWKLWILSAGIALLLMAGGVRIHKLKEEKYELQNRLEREVQQNIAKEVLRFHVIANSDTKEDQKLKMQVKTELLEYMNGFLKESDGLEETKETVLGHLTEIKQTAKEIVEESGYEYRVEAKMEKCEFPEKVYGNCTFPKGEYETLTVTIGAGKGHNWWCVLVYFGDTARVPYGSKSKEIVLKFSRQIVRFLQLQDVKAIVVACNTASALALEEIKKEIDIPIIGVVEPGAKVAASVTKNKKIGLIGTKGTVHSKLYPEIIHRYDKEIQVFGQPCPLFVPLVEEGWLKDDVTVEVARRYVTPLLEQGIDTLILGCTHYPLLRSLIQKLVGDSVTLVNPAYETAKELERLLKSKGLENLQDVQEEFPYRFYVSDAAEQFQDFANSILPYDVKMTKQINIEEY